MNGFDKVLSRVVLGTIAPVSLMLTGWWGGLGILGDHPAIGSCALAGFAAGVVLDVTLLRNRLDSLFALGTLALSAVAAFYSVMIYGFFMGFPVFNAVIGIAGGYVVGRRSAIAGESAEKLRRKSRTVAGIATALLFALCVATAVMALNEPTLGSQLQGMFALDFEVTQSMIYFLIFAGGGGLLAFQYAATVLTARRFGARRRSAGV